MLMRYSYPLYNSLSSYFQSPSVGLNQQQMTYGGSTVELLTLTSKHYILCFGHDYRFAACICI